MSSWVNSSYFRSKQKLHPAALSTPDFSIRNLTGTPLHLVLLERFKSPNSTSQSGLSSVFSVGKNLTSLALNATPTPSSPKLAEDAKSFFHRDVDIPITPFTIKKTEIKAPLSEDNEIVRLTFTIDGQKYRAECPCPTHLSQTMHPLTPSPKLKLTAIYLPQDTFVCIFNSADLDSWMRHLHDASPLSALSIPGTHNSPTHYNALPSVRCQAVSPRDQLENGVRFFDIRVQPEGPNSSKLILVHSVFPISLTGTKYFHDLELVIVQFLERHPSESIIMSLKREGAGNATDSQLARILIDHYTSSSAPHGDHWYTDPSIPLLSSARGKIVLLRRFHLDDAQRKMNGGRGFGINASAWADNSPHDLQEFVCVQDFYEVLETMNIEKKIQYATAQSERAGDVVAALPGITTDKTHPVPPQPFYLNFLSASNFFKVGCWPDRIAAKVNPAMLGHLCLRHHKDIDGEGEKSGDGGTGIVVCDYVGLNGDWDLVKLVVGCNSRLMVREMELTE